LAVGACRSILRAAPGALRRRRGLRPLHPHAPRADRHARPARADDSRAAHARAAAQDSAVDAEHARPAVSRVGARRDVALRRRHRAVLWRPGLHRRGSRGGPGRHWGHTFLRTPTMPSVRILIATSVALLAPAVAVSQADSPHKTDTTPKAAPVGPPVRRIS